MNDLDIGYAAGLLDGEGSIAIRKYTRALGHIWYYAIEIQIYNNHRPVLEWLVERLGGKIFNRKRHGNRKPGFVWRAWGQKAAATLRLLRPQLIIKSEHADKALSLYDIPRTKKVILGKKGWPRTAPEIREQQNRLFEAMKALNHRGLAA